VTCDDAGSWLARRPGRALSDPTFADEVLEHGIQNALAFLR
jgi:hypothetical protein